jgi:hypothetical protein
MTEGSPCGSAAALGEMPVGAAAGEPASVGGADEPFGREPTGAEGRWAVQAVVRHASARATRLSPDRFVTLRPPAMSPTCVAARAQGCRRTSPNPDAVDWPPPG